MPTVTFKCRGVNVDFPFEPYECQKDYMSKVIECLQTSKNGILESPTGTGKTVSLLCSTLAWRHAYIATQEFGRCVKENAGEGGEGGESGYRQELSKELKEGATGSGWGEVQEGNFVDRPRIIYASRTHSQLSQAVDQLKDTTYRPRVSIIGSREQLCIHPEVQGAESNTAKVHMCRAKVDSRMCHFHNNLDQKKGDKAFSEGILDIEDLVKLGNKHKVCPYYMAKELKTSAEIVFMPYNYLLDPKSRRIHGVELSGNVVIFDEAHNVERICEESASFELTSIDLSSCIQETDKLWSKTVEVEELNKDFRDDNAAEGDFVPRELAEMKLIFLALEEFLSEIQLPASGTGVTKPGGYIFELFGRAKVTSDKRQDIMSLVDKMITHLTSSSSLTLNKAAGLQKFSDIMNIIYSRDTPNMSGHNQTVEMSNCYKVHIRGLESNKKKQRTDLWTSSKAPEKKGFVLSYWCFSPGFSMQELVSQGVRSIILTSGTLAPLASFKSELKIDFPIQLENPHVIERHQMQVGIVTRGPDKTVLNSSYQTRFNKDYILSLGNAIVNFARIVPNGLLVFFPSYPVMNHCLEVWQEDGLSNRIRQYKEMFVEPKGKADFVAAMEGFYEKVKDPTLNGASFFAVCRGKVSEGLDFADINGRAVVITGLPFPPRMDPRVTLKMQYLDEMKRKDKRYLSGQDWYRQQASRAVNQAIGRVIRHKEDYGAILLCDTRFTSRDAKAQLPLWLRPYVCEYNQFGHAVRDLTNFFRVAEKKMPAPKVKKPRSATPILYETETINRDIPGPSNRQPAMKARELDSHVRSLKRNRDGSHVSEDQLLSMYEDSRPRNTVTSTGLLDALSNAEGIRSCRTGFLFNAPLKEQTNVDKNKEDPRKRKKIIIKQRGADNTSDDQGSTTSSDTTGEPAKQKSTGPGQITLSAVAYIEEVKRVMSKESYDNFSGLIRSYKKTCDLNSLVSNLADLFEHTDRHYLFRNFYTFVRPSHKKEFDSVCQVITGHGCGFKPEHAIPRKKLERHKESAAAKKCDIVKVKVTTIETKKTETVESSKSTSSASNLDTASHLNQGNLPTTHSALGMHSLEQGKQSDGNKGDNPEDTVVCDNAKKDKKPEIEPTNKVSDTEKLHVASISHNASSTGDIDHKDISQDLDLRSDVKQSTVGMQCDDKWKKTSRVDKDEKCITQKSSERNSCNEHSSTLPKTKPCHTIVADVISVDSQSSDSSNHKSASNSAKSSENVKHQTEPPHTSTTLKPSANSPKTIVKKKQVSIMDLFKKKPHESKVSTPPAHHNGNGKSERERKQKIPRKVLVPETPDRNGDGGTYNLDCQEDECKGSQESNTSLISEASSGLGDYTEVLTASVEKLKHRVQKRSEGDISGDEMVVRKEKKSKRKLDMHDDDMSSLPSASQNSFIPNGSTKTDFKTKHKTAITQDSVMPSGSTKTDFKIKDKSNQKLDLHDDDMSSLPSVSQNSIMPSGSNKTDFKIKDKSAVTKGKHYEKELKNDKKVKHSKYFQDKTKDSCNSVDTSCSSRGDKSFKSKKVVKLLSDDEEEDFCEVVTNNKKKSKGHHKSSRHHSEKKSGSSNHRS